MRAHRLKRKLRAAVAAATLGAASIAMAQSDDLIHADTPLWAPGVDGVWPQHFEDGRTFGCIHSIKLGDWRYSPRDEGASDHWYRLTNYGLMHCHINLAEAYEAGHFGSVQPAFLIRLGASGSVELWALQIGARPGSDYLLLSRPSKPPVDNDHFAVLQRQCPVGKARGGEALDVLRTDYCSIGTRAELVALAERMAALPPLGTLAFEKRPPAEDR